MIELRQLSKSYGSRLVVKSLSLEVAAGEIHFLLGDSGCGKTTTLKMVNRLVEPSSGSVSIAGSDTRALPLHDLRRAIGYGFQEVGLFPHLSVGENIAITPRLLGWDDRRQRQRVDELLEMMELEPDDYRDRSPTQLSGGQAQRIGLARALAAKPRILLLDEPFGALDPLIRDRLQQLFKRLCADLDLTVLFVTHDMVEALLLADRISVLGNGRLLQTGTAGELLHSPADETVRQMMATPARQARALEELLGKPDPYPGKDSTRGD